MHKLPTLENTIISMQKCRYVTKSENICILRMQILNLLLSSNNEYKCEQLFNLKETSLHLYLKKAKHPKQLFSGQSEKNQHQRQSSVKLIKFRVFCVHFSQYPLSKVLLNSVKFHKMNYCLLYTSPSPRDRQKSRMPSSA